MKFAYELSPRQSSRLIEQARRQEVSLELQPRIADENVVLSATVVRITQHAVRVELGGEVPWDLPTLLGCYCDARLTLGDHRYLFEASVLEVGAEPAPGWLELSCPDRLSVSERRRFWRATLAEASTVYLTPMTEQADGEGTAPDPTEALLCNLSPDGLACTVTEPAIDRLLIGEPVHVSFELPGEDRTFDLTADVCNKMPAGTEGKYVVGLQFILRDQDTTAHANIEALRKVLYKSPTEAPREGSDR